MYLYTMAYHCCCFERKRLSCSANYFFLNFPIRNDFYFYPTDVLNTLKISLQRISLRNFAGKIIHDNTENKTPSKSLQVRVVDIMTQLRIIRTRKTATTQRASFCLRLFTRHNKTVQSNRRRRRAPQELISVRWPHNKYDTVFV